MSNPDPSSNDNQPSVPVGLKIFVYALGVTIIVMLIALIVKVMGGSDEPVAAAVGSEGLISVTAEGVPEWVLDVPDGARVKSTHMERGILTIVVTSAEGDEIWLIDAKKQMLLGKVVLE